MDLGIADRTAIVCGASAGLGKAIAATLAGEGVQVTMVARGAERLAQSADEIESDSAMKVKQVAADITTVEGRAAALARCPRPDILINNAGGPPIGDFRKLTRADWLSALNANMLSAIDLINAVLDGMIEQGFGRIINITSYMVKAPVAMLSLSNGARAGLTGYIGGIARTVAQHNVTLNNLLPGQFNTDRLRSNHEKIAAAQGQTLAIAQRRFIDQIPAQRFGAAEEFGAYAAFLCSQQAGFVTGQNVLMDGGEYAGLF